MALETIFQTRSMPFDIWNNVERKDATLQVLLIEDEPQQARHVISALASPLGRFRLVWRQALDDAEAALHQHAPDIILLDLTLPDTFWAHALDRLVTAVPHAMIIGLSDTQDPPIQHEIMQRGMHDVFFKCHLDGYWLPRVLKAPFSHQATLAALRRGEERFRRMIDALPHGTMITDSKGSCTYSNAAYRRIVGPSVLHGPGTHWSLPIHPDDRPRLQQAWAQARCHQQPFHAEARIVRPDQTTVWVRITKDAIQGSTSHEGDVQTIEVITEQKNIDARLRDAEDALHAATNWAQVTLNSIGDAVMTTDLDCRVTYLNRVAETLTGWSSTEAIGKPLAQVFPLINCQTHETATSPARRAMQDNRTVGLAMDRVLIRQDGSQLEIEDSAAPIHDRNGRVIGAVIVFHDARQSPTQSAKLAYQAQHDALTGLPNRILLAERLTRAIGLAHRHQHQVALIYMDLDAFKPINDSLGHALGDSLLQSVAGRLSECVRDTDTVCRQGGDEFVVLLSEIEKPQDAAKIAEKILAALAEPYRIGSHELRITTSIGISLYPDDGTDDHTLLHNADTAMYHAKKCGRNHYQFFKAEMNALMMQRSYVETQLHRALKEDAIFLDFQPKIDIATGYLGSVEALVRWRDPNLGLMTPSSFLPIAETCGLIVPIGHWVLREACRQLQAWYEEGVKIVPMAVNMSAFELRDKTLPARITDILTETELEARFLELEVTETDLMHLTDASASTLFELSGLGIRIAIDDFGAGSASLKHLKRLPIDTLNIAPCFVHDMIDNPDDASFIKSIINLGQNLALRVVAKGVETQAQFELLMSLGCDGAQGFLFSEPLSATDIRALLDPAWPTWQHHQVANGQAPGSPRTPAE
ncbi:EAL domain-containing protein [Halomonas sp. TRM85114]|nr:EAL domain-containing protein [Halomonas jincaotanensis]